LNPSQRSYTQLHDAPGLPAAFISMGQAAIAQRTLTQRKLQ